MAFRPHTHSHTHTHTHDLEAYVDALVVLTEFVFGQYISKKKGLGFRV